MSDLVLGSAENILQEILDQKLLTVVSDVMLTCAFVCCFKKYHKYQMLRWKERMEYFFFLDNTIANIEFTYNLSHVYVNSIEASGIPCFEFSQDINFYRPIQVL